MPSSLGSALQVLSSTVYRCLVLDPLSSLINYIATSAHSCEEDQLISIGSKKIDLYLFQLGPNSKISPPPFFSYCFPLESMPPIHAVVHVVMLRSSVLKQVKQTNEGRLLLYKQAHDKRGIEEITVCVATSIGLDYQLCVCIFKRNITTSEHKHPLFLKSHLS